MSANTPVELLNNSINAIPINESFHNTMSFDNPFTSSISSFPYHIIAFIIAAVGLLANSVVILAMSSRKLLEQKTDLLIMNQMLLDLFSCFILLITYSLSVLDLELVGTLGRFICFLFISHMLTFIGLMGSVASLVIIALERYGKIVHPIAHRKYFRQWMIYVGIALTWGNGVVTGLGVFWTSDVVYGECVPYWFWTSPDAQASYYFVIIAAV